MTFVDSRGPQERRIVGKGACLVVKGRADPVPCEVLDATDSGARIKVAEAEHLPSWVSLEVDEERVARLCAVIWRRLGEIGVTFEGVTNMQESPTRPVIETKVKPMAVRDLRALVRR